MRRGGGGAAGGAAGAGAAGGPLADFRISHAAGMIFGLEEAAAPGSASLGAPGPSRFALSRLSVLKFSANNSKSTCCIRAGPALSALAPDRDPQSEGQEHALH